MQSSNSPVPNWRRHTTLALLALVYVFSFIDRNVIAIVLEPIKQEFGVSDTLMGLLTGLAFAILYAGLSLPLGRMADNGANRRNMVAICCGLWSFATMACGMAQQFWQMMLARMTVAVGEAGGMAPSVSMVSDLYPPHRRSLAMSAFMLGPNLGLLAAMVLGGWIAQEYGWRSVFIWFGAPGIVLAGLLLLLGKEPGHGVFDKHRGEKDSRPFFTQLNGIIRVQGFSWIAMGCALAGMAGYGYGIWAPTFMVRNYEMSLAHAGISFGIASGVFATIGSIFAGMYCDRLANKDARWQVWMPMIGVVLSLPMGIAFLTWPADAIWTLGELVVPHAIIFAAGFSFFASWWPSLSYAAVSHVMTSRQRATGAAALNLFLTLFGAGLGPMITGMLSDLFGETGGLKYALIATLSFLLLSGYCYWRAAQPYTQRMAAIEQDNHDLQPTRLNEAEPEMNTQSAAG